MTTPTVETYPNVPFWNQKVEWKEAGDYCAKDNCVTARVDGHHYMFALDDHILRNTRGFLGFGGAVWYVLFIAGPHIGKLRVTNNLWHQGDIPLDYKEALPDNAVFLTKDDFLNLIQDQVGTGYHKRLIDPRPHAAPFLPE